MPKRPPKKWFYSTLKKVKKVKGIKSPQRLVGWLWHHQMKPATKRAVLKASEKVKRISKRRRR
jgi:hypothetical protein